MKHFNYNSNLSSSELYKEQQSMKWNEKNQLAQEELNELRIILLQTFGDHYYKLELWITLKYRKQFSTDVLDELLQNLPIYILQQFSSRVLIQKPNFDLTFFKVQFKNLIQTLDQFESIP